MKRFPNGTEPSKLEEFDDYMVTTINGFSSADDEIHSFWSQMGEVRISITENLTFFRASLIGQLHLSY